jgi:transposase-like protein
MPRRENPFAGMVEGLTDAQFGEPSSTVAARRCREQLGFGTFDGAAEAWKPDPRCPWCHHEHNHRDSTTPSGRRRWLCAECGRTYTALTCTVFEESKKDFPTWAQFVRLMCYNAQIDLAAEVCGVSHQTAFEWRHRVMATLGACQERMVLRDGCWIDEVYVEDSALKNTPSYRPMRGLSRNQTCISVAIDVHKNPVAVVCRHGRPSGKRVRDALEAHVAEGTTFLHDKERAHNPLIRAVRGTSVAHKADTRDPDYLEGMKMVNSLCAWIRRFIEGYVGMRQENL